MIDVLLTYNPYDIKVRETVKQWEWIDFEAES
jgi:hypothetical protein